MNTSLLQTLGGTNVLLTAHELLTAGSPRMSRAGLIGGRGPSMGGKPITRPVCAIDRICVSIYIYIFLCIHIYLNMYKIIKIYIYIS